MRPVQFWCKIWSPNSNFFQLFLAKPHPKSWEKKVLVNPHRRGDIRVHVHQFESLFEVLFIPIAEVQLRWGPYRYRYHDETLEKKIPEMN